MAKIYYPRDILVLFYLVQDDVPRGDVVVVHFEAVDMLQPLEHAGDNLFGCFHPERNPFPEIFGKKPPVEKFRDKVWIFPAAAFIDAVIHV